MLEGRSYRFKNAIVRNPASSVINGLRNGSAANPDPELFLQQHAMYIDALKTAGAAITHLPALEEFPDSVFVEDTTICLSSSAIALRPGASSRAGEVAKIRPVLNQIFDEVFEVPFTCKIDGGDVLLSDKHAFIGLSDRTDLAGLNALASILTQYDYSPVQVNTPSDILHFKTDCGLLDSNTIFVTQNLATTKCFKGYEVILTPEGEEQAANIVRYNDVVLLSAGNPKSAALLQSHGFKVVILDTSQAAKIDGGLSCMSLRF